MKTKNILALCAILLSIELMINFVGNNTIQLISAVLFIITLVVSAIVIIIFAIKEKKNVKTYSVNIKESVFDKINSSPVEINETNNTPDDEFDKLVFDEIDRINSNRAKMDETNNAPDDEFEKLVFNEIDRINNTKQIMDKLQGQRKRQHYIKKPLMTDTEKIFYERLKTIFKGIYTIQPQIALRSIVDNTERYYASELHRYIDFGLLDDKENVVALIELNDRTHLTQKRHDRDMKVAQICSEAGIPLITFWANNEYTDNVILYKVSSNIPEQDDNHDDFTGEF